MDHEEIYLLMMDALDGELAPAGWEDLEAHLHLCSPCAQEWYALQAVETLLRTTPAMVPPVNLTERTLVRLPRPAYRTWLIGAMYSLLSCSVASCPWWGWWFCWSRLAGLSLTYP